MNNEQNEAGFVNEVNAVDEVEVFLVKRTLIKTGHVFVLDELVCHDFGEPKGQCAVCGGYCKWFAYSQALAFESLDLREKFDADKEVFNGVTFDDFEKYAKIVAYKVAHNLQNGFVMDKNDDPLNYGDK